MTRPEAKDIIFNIVATFCRAGAQRPYAAASRHEQQRAEGPPFPLGHHVDPDRRAGARCAVRRANCVPAISSAPRRTWPSRFGVSRIVARDALRTLEAQGIVDIKVGSGGGARIAQGNARLFAEALAVQLDLAGVSSARSWMRSAPSSASRPNSPPSTPPPRITRGCASSSPMPKRKIDDVAAFTRSAREFHLAVAEASHNRVAGRAADLAAARVLAGAESDADAASGAPHSRRAQGAGLPHRNARRRRRTPADGRPREDDRSPPRRRATRQAPQRSEACC